MEIKIYLNGGYFDGAQIMIPFHLQQFYVYAGDMINLYIVRPGEPCMPPTADFLEGYSDTDMIVDAQSFELTRTTRGVWHQI